MSSAREIQIVIDRSPRWTPDIRSLADAVIGPHPDTSHASYYEWLYEQSPAGKAFQALGFLDDRLVAHYAVVPVRLQTAAGSIVAGLGVNAFTRRDAQGRGVFARLVAAADRAAGEAGIGVTFVVPGPESEPWFRTVLRYTCCGELTLFVRPARLGRLVAQAHGPLRLAAPLAMIADLALRPAARLWRARAGRESVRLRELDSFGSEFDALWTRAGGDWDLGVVRDVPFLRWRYSVPTRNYRVTGAWVDGRLAASVASRVKTTHHMSGLSFGSIVDVLAEPTEAGDQAAALLVGEAVARLTAEGADLTVCQMSRASRSVSALRRNGFWPVPGRRHAAFRPILVRGLPAGQLSPRSVHFTGADYDMG